MPSRVRQVGVARSKLLGKGADRNRNRHRYTVGAASAIWPPERAVRLIRRTPEKLCNKPPPPICITSLVFQSRTSIPADPLLDTPGRIVHSEVAFPRPWFETCPTWGASSWAPGIQFSNCASDLLTAALSNKGPGQSRSIAAFNPSSTSRRDSDGRVPSLLVSLARSRAVT